MSDEICNSDISSPTNFPLCRHTSADQGAVLGKLGEEAKVVKLEKHQFIMPGLIDTHIHASQFPNAGLALDLTLLDWLERSALS